MPILTPDSLQTALRHKRIEPVYLMFGEEEFLIEEVLEELLAATVDETTRGFNFDVFHGSETQPDQVVARASAYPLMADRRVLVVRDIDRMFAGRSSADSAAPLMRYVAQPAPTTVLIMTAATSDFLPKGKSAAKGPYAVLLEHAACVQFRRIYDRDIPSWIAGRIRSRGREIAADAVEMFVNYAGGSLRMIANEIEKLFTFVQERRRITVEDVRAVVGASKTYNIFELQKAVGARNLERSVHIAERMLQAGESEQMIISMITRYFTILWRLSEVRTKTRDTNEIARGVGVSPFFLNDYLAALGKYPVKDLQRAFEQILNTDLALKTSRLPDSIALQMMLIGIIGTESVAYPVSAGA